MSDPVTEALRVSGLENLLNSEDPSSDTSMSLSLGDQIFSQSESLRFSASVPNNTFTNVQGPQVISSNHNPIIIRVGALPSQPQILGSQVPLAASQSFMPSTGVILGGSSRPQFVGGTNQISQHAVSSQNGRVIKFVPRAAPTQGVPSPVRAVVSNVPAASSGGLLVLSNAPVVPQKNVQSSNIRHITLPTGSRPVQLPVANKNGLFRLNVAPRSPMVINRPAVVPLSAAGIVPNSLSPNIPVRVVTARPNISHLTTRPLTVLNHNVASNASKFLCTTAITNKVVLGPMQKNTTSPPNPLSSMISNSPVLSHNLGEIDTSPSHSNISNPTGIFTTTNTKIETFSTSDVLSNIALSNDSEDNKPDVWSDNIPSNEKQSNNCEDKKPSIQATDSDSRDIWAALGELAEFSGLKQEELGKSDSKGTLKSEPGCDINEYTASPATAESQIPFSIGGPVNRFQGIQKVVIGDKLLFRPEFMGASRIPLHNFKIINGAPTTLTPQMRQNGHVVNLKQSVLPVPVIKEEEAEEELGHAETFSEYKPTKLKFGCKHPDSVVESASLSSVEAPDVNYTLKLPRSCWENGLLSAVQLESITYACQKHETFLPNHDRAGFLIGDGAGVGKGRIISGIIYENYLKGRKRALWLSVSNDLKVDAERDLYDIGATNIKVYSLNKFKYEKISSKENGKVKSGVVFATYSSLVGQSKIHNKYTTRLQQLVKWLSKESDSVIVFDECHKAKNLFSSSNKKATKTSEKVLELQNKLRNARVIYASATGATEPQNMGYMIRLGLWGVGTPFQSFSDFVSAVERRGVGAMEMVAMEMKQRGTYIARQLSFKGVSFHVEDVELSEDFIEMYNKSVQWWVDAREKFQQASALVKLNATQNDGKKMWGQFWSSHQRFFKYLCISSKIEHCVRISNKAIKQGKAVVIGLQSTGESRMKDIVEKESMSDELDDFVSTAKEVLKNLVERYFPCSIPINSRASSPKFNSNNKRIMENDLTSKKNKKLKKESDSSDGSDSSDDEDASNDEGPSSDESDYNPFARNSDEDSSEEKTPEKKKPKKKKKARSSEDENEEYFEKLFDQLVKKNSSPDTEIVEEAMIIKRKLLKSVERLGNDLPPNALDDLINKLGGPSRVAEMTGRKGRLVSGEGGVVRYEKRNDFDASLEAINLSEKQKFMDGEKLIAIISEAASSGVSLQADRRAINQRRRVHITLELPWSADRAIQQFGRTHRSNQVSAPEYIFLISKLAGERRFASTVAKRLECLGALTHGDRRAAEARDLSQFNIDTKFGRSALDAVLKSVIGAENPLVPPYNNEEKTESFYAKVRQSLVGVGILSKVSSNYVIEKDSCNITKFLNRILGMEVETQNSLFRYFTEVLGKVILNAKKEGKWDLGILDIGSSGELVEETRRKKYEIKVSEIHTSVILHTISVDRGMTWEVAQKLSEKFTGSDDGIYRFKGGAVPDRYLYILAVSKRDHKNEKWFEIYKPNNGRQPNLMSHKDLKKSYERVLIPTEDVVKQWQRHYERSLELCSHKYERGFCLNSMCEVGKRTRIYHVLSGSVLSVWTNMEQVLSKNQNTKESRLQVIRLKTSNGQRIVGVLIHQSVMEPLMQALMSGNASGIPSTSSISGVSSSFKAHFSSSTPDMFLSPGWGHSNGSNWR